MNRGEKHRRCRTAALGVRRGGRGISRRVQSWRRFACLRPSYLWSDCNASRKSVAQRLARRRADRIQNVRSI